MPLRLTWLKFEAGTDELLKRHYRLCGFEWYIETVGFVE